MQCICCRFCCTVHRVNVHTTCHGSRLPGRTQQPRCRWRLLINVVHLFASFQVIFTDPYYAAQYNRHTSPQASLAVVLPQT